MRGVFGKRGVKISFHTLITSQKLTFNKIYAWANSRRSIRRVARQKDGELAQQCRRGRPIKM